MTQPSRFVPDNPDKLPLDGHRPIDLVKNKQFADWPLSHTWTTKDNPDYVLKIPYNTLAGGHFAEGDTLYGPGNGDAPEATIGRVVDLSDTEGYILCSAVEHEGFADGNTISAGTVTAVISGDPTEGIYIFAFPQKTNMQMIQVRATSQRGEGEPELAMILNPFTRLGASMAVSGPFAKTVMGGDVYNIRGYDVQYILFENGQTEDSVDVWGFILPEYGGAFTFPI